MKTTLRIQTLDQYSFIEIDLEGELTPEQVMEKYQAYKKSVTGGVGLDTKEFNRVLDRYLTEKTMDATDYEDMNTDQIAIIQSIKRSFARTNK